MATGYTYIFGVLTPTGGSQRPNRFLEDFRRGGGNVRELERWACAEFPDAQTTAEAMRRLGQRAQRSEENRNRGSDLFDDPVAGWDKNWEMK